MDNEYIIRILLQARDAASGPLLNFRNRLAEIRNQIRGNNTDLDAFDRRVKAAATSVSHLGGNLRSLNADFQGLQIALVVKYAQALLSALIALGGQLVAVASSAAFAGAALGGALVTGISQAIPVIGLLTAALARLGAVSEALKAQTALQKESATQATAAQDQQRASADRVNAAEQSLARARQQAVRARDDLTRAERDARRELEDTLLAQERARLGAAGAEERFAEAKRRVALAQRGSGDIVTAQMELDEARLGVKESAVARTRTREDAARLGGSIENTDRMIAARRSLADATRGVVQAQQQLTTAQVDGARAAAQETAAQTQLEYALSLLSPAEQKLYEAVLRIKETYRQQFRPITDIIVGSFTNAVNKAREALLDNRLINAATELATKISGSIRQLTNFGLGAEGRSFLGTMMDEASRNIKPFTDSLVNILRIIQDIAVAAAPAFHGLLEDFRDLTKAGDEFTSDRKGLSKFFDRGADALRAWVSLLGSIINLFAAIAGVAEGEGTRGVRQLADYFNDLADKVRQNKEEVKEFFAQAAEGTRQLLRIIPVLAKELFSLFSSEQIKAFADILIYVFIPALVNVVRVIGALTGVFHQFLSLPFVRDVAMWAVTFTLLHRALLLVGHVFTILFGGVRLLISAFTVLRAPMLAIALAGGSIAPVLGAILVIGVAVAALLLLLDRRFHFLKPTMEAVSKAIGKAWEFIKEAAEDAFEWFKQAGKDFVDWVKDVWNQGLLYWLRYPFVEAFKFLRDLGVFRWIKDRFNDIMDFFGADSGWAGLADMILAPFKFMWRVLKPFIDIAKEGILLFLDLIAGRFDKVGEHIANIWYRVFSTLHAVIADVLNGIISGINTAIDGINKVSPFDDIGKISFHMSKMPVSRESADTLAAAKRGEATMPAYGGQHASGGPIRARQGGLLAHVGEGGYDEVILTTDPKHAQRQKMLLSQYLMQMAPHFAQGGYVQGASPPRGSNIRKIVGGLFKAGYNVTSGGEYRGTGTFHDQGYAVDFGDSVNNLQRLWNILFPAKAGFEEFYGPTYLKPAGGLYERGTRFSDGDLQAQHQDHIHLAILDNVAAAGKRLGHMLRNIASNVGGGGIAELLRRTTGGVGKLLGGLGKDPRRTFDRGNPFGAILGTLWRGARASVRGMYDKVAEYQDTDIGAQYSGGALSRGEVARIINQAMNIVGVPRGLRSEWRNMALARAWQESTFNPNAQNNWDSNAAAGDPSRGLFQTIMATFNSFKLPRMGNIWNPLHNAVAAFRYMLSAYGHGDWAQALQRMVAQAGVGYQDGGPVSGQGTGDVIPAMLEPGEHIFSKREVQRAGGHGVLAALRRTLGGGGQSTTGAYGPGGEAMARFGPQISGSNFSGVAFLSFGRVIDRFTEQIADLADSVKRVGNKVRGAGGRIRAALQEGGIFDRLAEAIEKRSEAFGRRIQRMTFGRRSDGSFGRLISDPVRTAGLELQAAQQRQQGIASELGALQGARGDNARAIDVAERQLRRADTKKEREAAKKRLQVLRANAAQIAQRINDVQGQNADAIQAIVEAQENLRRAQVDAINQSATRALASTDRRQRLANVFGPNFGANTAAIAERAATLNTQRGGLANMLNVAAAAGDTELVQSLTEQIEELDIAIKENTKAAEDNTRAQRQFNIDAIQGRAGFRTNLFGGLGNILQSVTGLTGVGTTTQQASLVGQTIASLTTAGGGLRDQLFSWLGIDLRGLSGTGLVDKLSTLDFDAITAGMSQEDRAQFEALIAAIVDNEKAVLDNTKAQNDLLGLATGQSFSSSLWSMFRTPVFSGGGSLLPQFAIPSFADGGYMPWDGPAYLHRGERVLKPGQTGDTHNWFLTHPVERFDPKWASEVMEFNRSNRRAT